ncbi:replication-relaxation family protein [Kitasatospora sp. NPDC092039]|uniref:replication-relaxation family protein n=1 Tax=Kitasatospora sp. NPDC092039 TaxID=3364086 RepID=UPI00381B23C0
MTAGQVARLLYPNQHDDNRYAQRRLRRLVEAGHLLRLRELPTPQVGSAPHVFTLADRGRRFLQARGVRLTSGYYRPSEERAKARDNPFMEHTLAAVDVLVAAELLNRQHPLVSVPRLFTERQLKREAVRVQPAGDSQARPVAVIPDAWLELAVAGEAVYVALELDRGTEEQKYWRRKVAALTAWALGPYRQLFEADNLTVATVVPTTARRRQLSSWTAQELYGIGQPALCDVFLFTETSPLEVSAEAFFFGALWFPADRPEPVSLLDLPGEGQS